MDFSQLLSALLAGGFAGQLTTLILNNRLSENREYKKWLRNERLKVSADLIDLASSSSPRNDYDTWPTDIQSLCQKIKLLCIKGSPPESLSVSMEKVFQNAKNKKNNTIENHDAWVDKMRKDVRILRVELSELIHSNDHNYVFNKYSKKIFTIFKKSKQNRKKNENNRTVI